MEEIQTPFVSVRISEGGAYKQTRAKNLVFEYVVDRLEKTDTHVLFAPDDVYVVWFASTLQNWKACLSTTLPDGMYYELTHDGDESIASSLIQTSKYNPAGPDRFA